MTQPPRDVPGYRDAVAAGLIPAVPSLPPRLVTGLPAGRFLTRVLAGSAAVMLILVLLHPPWVPAGVFLGCGLAWWFGTRWFLRRVGDRNKEEFRNGYTTLRLVLGNFRPAWWPPVSPRRARVPWDYSGLWVLDGRPGRVIAPPTGDGDPPGYYPSPNRPGRLELWTGTAWTTDFHAPGT